MQICTTQKTPLKRRNASDFVLRRVLEKPWRLDCRFCKLCLKSMRIESSKTKWRMTTLKKNLCQKRHLWKLSFWRPQENLPYRQVSIWIYDIALRVFSPRYDSKLLFCPLDLCNSLKGLSHSGHFASFKKLNWNWWLTAIWKSHIVTWLEQISLSYTIQQGEQNYGLQ